MFKSQNYIFRHSVVGQAFADLGIGNVPLVRDERISGVLRHPRDRWNEEPSREVQLDPIVETPGAFGKKHHA